MIEYVYPRATAQHRLGGKAVDIAMYIVTFGIGWLIWSLVVWGQGQTPGKQIVKLRVYDKANGQPVKWGHMAVREFLLPIAMTFALVPILIFSVIPVKAIQLLAVLLMYLGALGIHLVDALWIFRKNEHNRMVDVFAKTDVLNESPN